MRVFAPLALLLLASTLSAAEPSKLPVPEKEAQEKALSEVKSVLGADFKLPKSELAKKMLGYARDETDPVRRYVFGVEATKAAIEAGDGPTICATVDLIAQRYSGIDASEATAKAFESALKLVRKEDANALVRAALEVADKAAEEDNYAAASRVVEATAAQARRLRNPELGRRMIAKKEALADGLQQYQNFAQVEKTLTANPTDPEANLVAGKYYALVKGNWEKAVPMLALGNDADLKQAAALDLAQPAEAGKQVELGDKWWELSDKSAGQAKLRLMQRAAHWYTLALPAEQSSFVKAKLAKRIAEVHDKEPKGAAIAGKRPAPGAADKKPQQTQVWSLTSRKGQMHYFFFPDGTGVQETISKSKHPFHWSRSGDSIQVAWDDSPAKMRLANGATKMTGECTESEKNKPYPVVLSFERAEDWAAPK